jgi:hypothetical protein
MGKRYCWLIRHKNPARFIAAVLWVDCPTPSRSPSCRHGDGIHVQKPPSPRISAAGRGLSPAREAAQMISSARLLSLVAVLNLWWLECAQNPAVFCYRISWDLLAPLCRSRFCR